MVSIADIVFVDDDGDIIETAREYLSRDYDIEAFTSAESALDFLKKQRARLLVTDLRMPGLNGFMLIDEVKAIYPDIKVLLISGYIDATSSKERSLYEKYTPHCLSKPFRLSELLEEIRSILECH